MAEHTYKIIELVGSSKTSIEDAVDGALSAASESLDHLDWFEIVQTRGQIQQGRVGYYQVVLKVGFRLQRDD